jgi:hypothetical protein
VIVLHEAEMKFDENYCNVTSNHERKPGEIYKLGYRMDLFVEVRTFFVKVGIALPTANGKFESFIQNTVLDVCKYLKTNNANLILRLFFNGNFGNKKFPKGCPIKPDVYYMENFRINDNMLVIRSGETKFLITVEFCTKLSENSRMHCILSGKFYGEMKDQAKWQQEVEKMSKIEAKN